MNQGRIIGAGGVSDRDSIALDTRKRRRIDNERRRPKNPGAMQEAMKFMRGLHNKVRMRSLDSTYNCMGMVFASRRTWVDPDRFDLIRVDDGYREVPKNELPEIGDVAVYRNNSGDVEHVGVVTGRRTLVGLDNDLAVEVLSQFGSDGEYFRLFLRIGEGSCGLGEELGDSFCSSDGVDGHEAEVVEYAT